MGILETFDQLSYKKVLSIAVFLAILFVVPISVFLVQQQTRINSRAAYEKPTVATQAKATPGPIPDKPPQVGRAWPWVGKIGDIIWIQGKNFGTNPITKSLRIGGITISDANIAAWDDNLIQAVIPEGVTQGAKVEVQVGSYPVSQSLPLVIYDRSTDLKLHKAGNELFIIDAPLVKKAILWTGDDEIPTKQHVQEIASSGKGKTVIFETEGLPILSVLLVDQKGNLIPYYVDPKEFDF